MVYAHGGGTAVFFPGWDAGTVATTSLTFGTGSEALNLSLPVLTPAALDAVSLRLLAAQAQHLACRPIAEIVEVIDCVIQLWLDPQYPYRQQAEAFLPIITHYSAPMVRHGLDTLLQAFRKDALWRLLQAELGTLCTRYVSATAACWRLYTGVWSTSDHTRLFGQCPGAAGLSLICALLVKSASLGKSASEEPLFAALFARSLWDVCPEIVPALP